MNRWKYKVRRNIASSQYEKWERGCKTCEWSEEVNTGVPMARNLDEPSWKEEKEDKEDEESSNTRMPYQGPSS
jgi:hypothetical protein